MKYIKNNFFTKYSFPKSKQGIENKIDHQISPQLMIGLGPQKATMYKH